MVCQMLSSQRTALLALPHLYVTLLLNLLSAADFLRQIKLLHAPEELVVQHPLLSGLHGLLATLHTAPSLSPKNMLHVE